jgi:hypothetical protein
MIEFGAVSHSTDRTHLPAFILPSRGDLLVTLERQELTQVGAWLAEERKLPLRAVLEGERVRGIFKETVQLASGKYALVQNAHVVFIGALATVIDKQLGKEISGAIRGNSVVWEFGRKRGLRP